jgi:hypothetical protein
VGVRPAGAHRVLDEGGLPAPEVAAGQEETAAVLNQHALDLNQEPGALLTAMPVIAAAIAGDHDCRPTAHSSDTVVRQRPELNR